MDTVKALAEVSAARSELRLTDAWKLYGKTPSTHTFKVGQHLDAAIAALQPERLKVTIGGTAKQGQKLTAKVVAA